MVYMEKNKGSFLYRNSITIGTLFLVVFGSLMIASAEMGNSVGESSYLTSVLIKQLVYATISLAAYFFVLAFEKWIDIFKLNIGVYWFLYYFFLLALFACRLFGQTNGAYAWIPLGPMGSIQPSEFCKTFMIVFAAKMFGKDYGAKNIDNFKKFAYATLGYVGVILLVQKDLGSAMVLFVMCFCMALIPSYKETKKIQAWMLIAVFAAIVGVVIVLSPFFTELLKKLPYHYQIARFLTAADPFLYRYDSGYHLVMALVSFANGGLFGLGYGNSTHKYMNFPNPSNDFILPIIVEELGIFGFLFVVLGYGLILLPIISYSMKTTNISSKIIMIGIFMYFICHFIFNVGGVSGLIPLTGVPLLIISSGGSSLLSCLMALSLGQSEINKNQVIEQ